jgi:hypothetical protein
MLLDKLDSLGGRFGYSQGAAAMPIRRYVGFQTFTPEALKLMSEAFTGACQALGVGADDEAKRNTIARVVIELARADTEISADALCDKTVKILAG